jgi:tetratricopeptide (TPR) repeat protein
MDEIPELAKQAMEQARRGDLHQALQSAKQAKVLHPEDQGLMMLVGILHSRRMELDEAADQFGEILRLSPGEPVATLELARILVGLNRLDEAEQLLGDGAIRGPEPKRLEATIAMRRGNFGEAARLLREVLSTDPRDFESWGNLGLSLSREGDPRAAVEALSNALQLRPDQERFRDAWAEAHIEAGSGEEALRNARERAAELPHDAAIRVTAARLEEMLGRPAAALATLEQALLIDPDHAPALLALARLNERQNRIDESANAIARLEALSAPAPGLPLLKAQIAFRRGDFPKALELAEAIPPALDPGARAELIGKIHDRLGNGAEAFAAFTEMNRDTGVSAAVAETRAKAFRDSIAARDRIVSRSWIDSWPGRDVADIDSSPIFVVGVPRSGTTLLDTLMMGHPKLCIAEEKPMLDTVARAVGGYRRLGTLDGKQLAGLRDLYFREARKHVADLDGRRLVDKQPFAIVDSPLIHRLFPDARFVFAERHPCDVALSCFITRFEPNPGLLNFTTMEDSARLYDQIMTFWTRCRGLLPLAVHELRYERLVKDAEGEMRPLLAFLGLEWTGSVLDHSAIAEKRRFINTPSYSQVVEPLYDRSIGRWRRYREQMEPVLPLLQPWAEAMGFEM